MGPALTASDGAFASLTPCPLLSGRTRTSNSRTKSDNPNGGGPVIPVDPCAACPSLTGVKLAKHKGCRFWMQPPAIKKSPGSVVNPCSKATFRG